MAVKAKKFCTRCYNTGFEFTKWLGSIECRCKKKERENGKPLAE